MRRTSRRRSGSPWRARGRTPFATRASLWLVDGLRRPIGWLGVDFQLFRLILEQRMGLETAPVSWRRHGGRMPVGAGMAMSMAWLTLAGLLPGILALATREPFWWMFSGQALWIFTLTLLTVTHFATILVDPTDVAVLASRPVDDRTLFATRIAHVLAYVLVLAACSALVPTIFGAFAFPPLVALVAYPLATLCSALLVLGGVTLAIALALRFAGPARFQRVVFWGQIGGAMVLILVPQLLPPLFLDADLIGIVARHRWLAFLVPPLAEHGLYLLLAGTGDRIDLALAALVVTVPVVIGVLTLRVASRSYVAAVGDPGTLLAARARGFAQGFFARLAPRVCSTRQACAAYGLALALSRRDKLFLRSVLPMTAMIVVMVVGMMMPRHSRGPDVDMAGIGLYYVLLLGATTLELSRLSESASAREWRRILPAASASALMEGSAKALLCGTVFPILLLLAAVLLAVFGPRALGDVALGVPLAAATLTFAAKSFLRTLPFTESAASRMNFDRLPRFLALMAVMGLLIGVHAVARMHWLALALVSVGALLLFRRGWRGLARWRPAPGSALARLGEQDEEDQEAEAALEG